MKQKQNNYTRNKGHFLWNTYGVSGKVDLIYIMFNSRVSSQKLGATDTVLCSPSLNKVKQNLGDSNE